MIEKRAVDASGKQHWCLIRPRAMRQLSASTSEVSEDTDDENWNTESTETVSGSSSSPTESANQETPPKETNTTINLVINDILVNIETHQEGVPKESSSVKSVTPEPLEGNYDNVIVYGKVRMDSLKNNQMSKSDHSQASTSATPNKPILLKKDTCESKQPREKLSKIRNHDENEADVFNRFSSTETNNRLRTIEQKLNKSNIKEALLKMATNLDTTNGATSNTKTFNIKKDLLTGNSKVQIIRI